MVDRIPLSDWPPDWIFRSLDDLDRPAKLFIMKILSRLSEKQDFVNSILNP